MPKTIRVTRAQVIAAQGKLDLAAMGYDVEITPAVIAIANAKPARREAEQSSTSDSPEDRASA